MDDEEALKRISAWSDEMGDGYPSLANFIAQDPDSEALVFRRFKRLATENILYLQGELIKLEDDFDAWESDVAAGVVHDGKLIKSMRSWTMLNEQASDKDRVLERRRAALAETMEVKMKSYYEALMLQRQIAMLETPSPRVLTNLRQWLHGASGTPSNKTRLDSNDKHMFQDESDLVALRPAIERDIVSNFLRDHWFLPSKQLSSSEWTRTRYFKEQQLTWLVSALSTLVASLLLTCPIIVLYFITNPHARLGLVIAFIVLFALGLSLSTGASRDNIFAATAAYSAVLVVFVSSNLANP